jgi:hypothetical protein
MLPQTGFGRQSLVANCRRPGARLVFGVGSRSRARPGADAELGRSRAHRAHPHRRDGRLSPGLGAWVRAQSHFQGARRRVGCAGESGARRTRGFRRRGAGREHAAEQGDELAAPHSITSSASCRNGSGIVSPRTSSPPDLLLRNKRSVSTVRWWWPRDRRGWCNRRGLQQRQRQSRLPNRKASA